jgi:hypothetical protein
MFNTVFKQPKQGTRDKKLLTRKMHQILLSWEQLANTY